MTETQTIRDESGAIIAWIRTDGRCGNERCDAAIRQGRPVHIIPAHLDPRALAEQVFLVLPTYHYPTVEDALSALETGWEQAETVYTREDRDSAYAAGVPVKVSREAART